MAVYG